MKNFIDKTNGQVYAFDDDVIISEAEGVYSFKTALGVELSSLPTTLEPYTPPPPDPAMLLEEAKKQKIEQIRAAFASASVRTVTDANGVSWSGGQDSGTAIFLACQMAQQLQQPDVTIWDSTNAPHQMTITDGLNLAALIGATYQQQYQQWQTLRGQVESASDADQVDAIVW